MRSCTLQLDIIYDLWGVKSKPLWNVNLDSCIASKPRRKKTVADALLLPFCLHNLYITFDLSSICCSLHPPWQVREQQLWPVRSQPENRTSELAEQCTLSSHQNMTLAIGFKLKPKTSNKDFLGVYCIHTYIQTYQYNPVHPSMHAYAHICNIYIYNYIYIYM